MSTERKTAVALPVTAWSCRCHGRAVAAPVVPRLLAAVLACTVVAGCVAGAEVNGGAASPTADLTSTPPLGGAAGTASPRSVQALTGALLTPAELASSYMQVPVPPPEATAASTDPKCAALIAYFNSVVPLDTITHADARFSASDTGPFVDEQIDAMRSTAAASDTVGQLKTAIAECPQVSLVYPSPGPVPFLVRPVTPNSIGANALAFRVTSNDSTLNFEFIQVLAPVDDVIVLVGFVRAPQSDIDSIVTKAVQKATRVLHAS